MGADTKANTLGRRLSLQIGDLRLVEDVSQCSGALGSDAVAFETARRGVGWETVREYRRVNGR